MQQTIPTLSKEQKRQAKVILSGLESSADLLPDQIRDWWLNYLHKHTHHYLDVLALTGKPKGALLEVGSVPGHLTLLLSKLGYDVRGIDLAPERLGSYWREHNLSMSQVDIEREPLPFPSGEFETVLFTEILEHLRINPLHALREVARVLTPGGRLLLSTPHITPLDRVRFLWGRSYQGNPVREFRKLEWLGHMGHIRLYSLDEINEFLQEVGLRMQSHIFGGSYDAGSGVKGKLITLMLDLYPKRDAFRRITYVRAEKT